MLDKEFKLRVNYASETERIGACENPLDPLVLMSELRIRISYNDIDKLIKQWNLPPDALIIKYLKEIENIQNNNDRYAQLFYLAIIGKNLYPTMKEIDKKVIGKY